MQTQNNTVTFMQCQVNNSLWNFTMFQIDYCKIIEARNGFEQWVTSSFKDADLLAELNNKPRARQQHFYLWYENGVLHGQAIGCKRVLRDIVRADSKHSLNV